MQKKEKKAIIANKAYINNRNFNELSSANLEYNEKIIVRNVEFQNEIQIEFLKNNPNKHDLDEGDIVFESCKFSKTSNLNISYSKEQSIYKSIQFIKCEFEVNPFVNRIFNSPIDFRSCTFDDNAKEFKFSKFNSFVMFQQGRFNQLPNFITTDFKYTPKFINCDIQDNEVSPEREKDTEFTNLKYLIYLRHSYYQSYSKLKSFAIDNGDKDKELHFFGGELRNHPEKIMRKYAKIYEYFSDYGRAILKPMLIWLFAIVFSGIFYFLSAESNAMKCSVGDKKNYSIPSSISLSLEKALPLSSLLAPDRSKENYLCLYGYRKSQETEGKRKEKYEEEPYIPQSVSLWGTLQTLFSIAMLFFFALGLRNRFRIKAS